MNRDSRGVLRGPCTSCACTAYTAGPSGLKCTTCSHPPGKHQNLSGVGAAPVAGHSATHSAGHLSGYSYSQSASAYSYDQQQQYPQATYGAGTTSTGTQHYQRQQSLPLCKASTCTNYVHYEQAVGVFDYCSPECRNSDLLQRERDRLKEDLRKLEEDLRTHARASAASHTGFGSTGYTSTFHTASTGKDRGAGITVRKQATVTVYFQKEAGKDLGLHFHEEPYNANGIKGLLITGVSTHSEAYKKIRSGELRLLDVILQLNGQDVTDSLRKAFAEEVKEMHSLHITVSRSISVPCTDSFLWELEKKTTAYVFALRNPKAVHQSDREFGITVTMPLQKLVVQGVSERTIARASGLKYNDVIVLYAQATEGKMERCITMPDEVQFKAHLKDAYKSDRSMVVVVRRENL